MSEANNPNPSPRAQQLRDELRGKVEELLRELYPDEAAVLVDGVLVTARTAFGDDGGGSSTVTTIPLDVSLPDYRTVGLLTFARDFYRAELAGQ